MLLNDELAELLLVSDNTGLFEVDSGLPHKYPTTTTRHIAILSDPSSFLRLSLRQQRVLGEDEVIDVAVFLGPRRSLRTSSFTSCPFHLETPLIPAPLTESWNLGMIRRDRTVGEGNGAGKVAGSRHGDGEVVGVVVRVVIEVLVNR